MKNFIYNINRIDSLSAERCANFPIIYYFDLKN